MTELPTKTAVAYLWFITTEMTMGEGQTLKADGELNIARTDHVLYLELIEGSFKAQFLDDTGIFAGCQSCVVFALRSSDNHLATCEDQSSRLGLTDSHDDSGKSLDIDVRSAWSVSGMDATISPLGYTRHYERLYR